jgi:hypothetical protein
MTVQSMRKMAKDLGIVGASNQRRVALARRIGETLRERGLGGLHFTVQRTNMLNVLNKSRVARLDSLHHVRMGTIRGLRNHGMGRKSGTPRGMES